MMNGRRLHYLSKLASEHARKVESIKKKIYHHRFVCVFSLCVVLTNNRVWVAFRKVGNGRNGRRAVEQKIQRLAFVFGLLLSLTLCVLHSSINL